MLCSVAGSEGGGGLFRLIPVDGCFVVQLAVGVAVDGGVVGVTGGLKRLQFIVSFYATPLPAPFCCPVCFQLHL